MIDMHFRPYQLTSLTLGVLIAGTIFYLVRRDRVHIRHTFWWAAVAVGALVLGGAPRIVDWIAPRLGVKYPPVLLLTVGFGLALIKILTMDMERADLERKVRRLSQRLAILEGDEKPEKRPR
jgi:hypothetical protein